MFVYKDKRLASVNVRREIAMLFAL